MKMNQGAFRSLFCGLCVQVVLALGRSSTNAVESQTTVFQDDFASAALFVEHFRPDSPVNWKVREGVLQTEKGGSAKANVNLNNSCRVEADVSLDVESVREGGFAGVNVGGCLFLLQPRGFWNVYREKGEKKSRGSFTKANVESGKLYHFAITRRTMNGGFAYKWEVDGEVISEFVHLNPEDDQIANFSLNAWRAGGSYDNLAVHALEAGAISNNTLRNGSFEYLQDGLPLYWMPGLNLDDLVSTYKNHENYWNTVSVDPKHPLSGKYALRIETNAQVPINGFKSFDTSVNKALPFTYSIWLKSDRSGVPAVMTIHEKWGKQHTKEIEIDTEWKKYSFTLSQTDKSEIWAGLRIAKASVIWADDAQVESGNATGEFRPSSADERIGKTDEWKSTEYQIPKGSPTLDGKIGQDWANALTLGDFRIVNSEEEPIQKTSAFLLHDENNLYIGFSCFEKNTEALSSGDSETLGKIAAGDCVEVFLDNTGEKRRFYHLFVNPDGGKLLIDPNLKQTWNPEWQVATEKHSNRWDVEIKIPFKTLADSRSEWGINLGRHEPRDKHNSCTSRVGPKFFSDVSRYDRFVLSPEAKLSDTGRQLSQKGSKMPAVYMERNFYMKEPIANVIAPDLRDGEKVTLAIKTADGKVIHSNSVRAKGGKKQFTLPISDLSNGNYRVEVEAEGRRIGTTTLVKLPFRENAVQIDQKRLAVLDKGKPYFVFAPFFQIWATPSAADGRNPSLEKTESIIKYLAGAKMKTVCMLVGLNRPNIDYPDYVEQLLNICDREGVKAILWTPEHPSLGSVVERVQPHQALLAWMLWDEPELSEPEAEVAALHDKFKHSEPYHPLIMNNTIVGIPSRFAGLNTDIISHDDYIANKPDRTVREILENANSLWSASRELRKPAFIFLEGANFQNHYREVTAGELVAQTYGSIIGGASGLWYFFGIPVGKESWEAYKRTNSEILGLSNVIFSDEEAPIISSNHASVITTTRKHNGKIYLITTNTENRTVNAKFRIPAGLGEASVLFEHRKVVRKNGFLEDEYGPHSRRVYVFDASAQNDT